MLVQRLKKSREYQKITQKGTRVVARPFVLLGHPYQEAVITYGITASRKLGGAVRRNRIKRRIRAAAEKLLPEAGTEGWGYVFIGRHGCADIPFPLLLDEMKMALRKVAHGA